MRGRLRARLLVAIAAVVSLAVALVLGLFGRVERGTTLVVVSVVTGALVAVVLSQLAVRWLDEAVRPLTERARRMQAGDLAVRSRIGRDEDVGQLGAAFDQLAGSLSETVSELRTERDLVSRILNGMQEGVLLLDKDGKVALMNPSLREMLLLRADAVGQPLLEVVRHAELKELLDRARTKQATSSGEVELGGLKPRRLLVRATSFSGQGGGLLAVFFDVTDIRRLESLRRDFVANVSHELRTPVTAILSASETLEMALAKDPEGAKRFLQIIDRNATRLQRLIEDLLDLSRIESRELKLRPEKFAFEPFATHLLGLFRDRADKKRISLRHEVGKGLEIDSDRRALEQVLTNLVDNAVKYCQEGSTVTLHAEGRGAGVLVRVSDDGPGIDKKHLPRLFERFYRVDAGRSREMGGTGLGLSIVKHLVESMGGTIDVSSDVGKGTSFEIVLPHASSRVRDRSSSEDVGGVAALALAAIALVASQSVACTRPAASDHTPRVLVGAGATLPYPLYSRWADDYAKVDPAVRINYQSIGSAAGVRGVSDGVVDFGATDDPASESPKHVRIPMTVGGIVLAYNAPIDGDLQLTPELVADVFLGTIARWDDDRIRAVNPGRALPSAAITVVHRAEGSGTSAAFTTYLARTSEPWKAKVGASAMPRFPVGVGAKGNEGVTALVKSTPNAIGYVELAYARQAGLPMALVKNRSGRFVAPSVDAIERAATSADDATLVDAKDPGAYPIAAVSYAVVARETKDNGTRDALARFFTWAVHDGQRTAPSLDYAALPPDLVQRAERAIAELR